MYCIYLPTTWTFNFKSIMPLSLSSLQSHPAMLSIALTHHPNIDRPYPWLPLLSFFFKLYIEVSCGSPSQVQPMLLNLALNFYAMILASMPGLGKIVYRCQSRCCSVSSLHYRSYSLTQSEI